MREFNQDMRRRYMDKKKPLRLKLQEQVMMSEVYKSSSMLVLDSEQAAYQRIIEIEDRQEVQGVLI